MHILVVDDKSAVRSTLTNILEQQGHSVQTAFNGLDALEKSQRESFDLYIIDHLMPVMNGVQLSKNLKSMPQLATTPIVFMTTQDVKSVKGLEEADLFYSLMAKPINETLLTNTLGELTNTESNGT